MLQPARLIGCLAGRHRRRQIDQPARVERKAADDLQRGSGAVCFNNHVASQSCIDDLLADHVFDAQQGIRRRLAGGTRLARRDQRAHRLSVHLVGRNAYQFALRPAQRRQLAAKDTAGIDINRVVEPGGHRNWRVPIDHRGAPAIISRPIIAYRQAELVGLARRLAKEGKGAHAARGAALIFRLHPGVRCHQLAVIQHQMGDQPIRKGAVALNPGGALLRRQRLDLRNTLLQAMLDLDFMALEMTQQLHVMVARHAKRLPGLNHAPDEIDRLDYFWPAIHQIAQKDDPASLRVAPASLSIGLVAKLLQEFLQLIQAAMYITDQIERAALSAPVRPERLALDARRLNLCWRQHKDVAKAFMLQTTQPGVQRLHMIAHHMRAKLTIRPSGIPLLADALRHVQHNRCRQHILLFGNLEQMGAILWLDIGCIDDRQFAQLQPQPGNIVQRVESCLSDALLIGVITDDGTIMIGTEYLRRAEMARRKGAFARTRRPDQHHQAEFRNRQHPLTHSGGRAGVCLFNSLSDLTHALPPVLPSRLFHPADQR